MGLLKKETFEEKFERMRKAQIEAETITCLNCGYSIPDDDWKQLADFISYQDADPKEWDCPECDTPHEITERVVREYDVSLSKQQEDSNDQT